MRQNGLDHVRVGYIYDGGSWFATKQGIRALGFSSFAQWFHRRNFRSGNLFPSSDGAEMNSGDQNSWFEVDIYRRAFHQWQRHPIAPTMKVPVSSLIAGLIQAWPKFTCLHYL
jgi:hypothetical protein